MEEKESFGAKLEAFFAGKGFYIVLLLCVAVIGVSAWSMLSGGGAEPSVEPALSVAGLEEDAAVVTGKTAPALVTEQPAPARTQPAPAPAAEPAAEPEPEPEPAAAIPEEPAPALRETGAASYFIWPVSGEIEHRYSMDMPVFNPTMQDWRTHDGVDIAAMLGTQVRAAANGTVAGVYYDDRYGTTVVLDHGGGLESVYAGLAATPTVSAGDSVGVGQIIGAVGDSALCEIAEASHLHFAMTLDGMSVDPNEYLP